MITSGRIVAAPVVTILLLQSRPLWRLLAFVLFVAAALSDLWDGYLARSRGQVTSFGQLVDPLADKLLLVSTLVPLYAITTARADLAGLPLFDTIPLWAVLILLGREVVITLLRFAAARRGRIVPARRLGKRKAVVQNIFIGAAILWVAFRTPGFGAPDTGAWNEFSTFHGWFTSAFLAAALLLTVVSAGLYLMTFSRILAGEHT
ncbi:MAG: CDP-alcohol phosphatidyltransferase family protein [Gemmatimonadota bacterium]|nr:CDP-alcohol phosphatidyltransferase family protein [Gemmatimonadota bacterium]